MRVGEKGLTFVEVLVAAFLIGVALVPLLHLYPGTLGFNVDSEINARLSAAAVRKMEEVVGIVRAPSGAAVQLDNSVGTGAAPSSSTSAVLAISPSANYVLILVGNDNNPCCFSVSSVTVGGVAATQIAVNNVTILTGYLYGLLNPPTGSQTVTVTLTGSTEHSWVAASFMNVSSATPLGGTASSGAISATPSAALGSRTSNTLLVGGFVYDTETGTVLTTTEGGGQTMIREVEIAQASTNMSRETSAGSAGNDMNWTVAQGSNDWEALIVELRASAVVGSSSGTAACPDITNCLLVWTTTTEFSSATSGVGRLDQVSVVACQDTNASTTCDTGERQVRYDAKVTTRP